jgi:hypothetical protein
VRAVVAKGEALQMVIHAHAQIVSDPLTDVLGVVVVDVGGDGTDDRDDDEGRGGEDSYVETGSIVGERADESFEPEGSLW